MREAGDLAVHLEARGEAAGAPMWGDLTRLRAAFDALFRAIFREHSAPATVVAECRRVPGGAAGGLAVVVLARDTDVQRTYEAEATAFDDTRGGLGLALPIARRVVERHGGRVWSPAPGPDLAVGQSALAVSFPAMFLRRPGPTCT